MKKHIFKDNKGASLILVVVTALVLVAFCSSALIMAAKNRDSLNRTVNESDYDNLYVYSVFRSINYILENSASASFLTSIFVDGTNGNPGPETVCNITGYTDEKGNAMTIKLTAVTFITKASVKFDIEYKGNHNVFYTKYFILYNDETVSGVVLEQCDTKPFIE